MLSLTNLKSGRKALPVSLFLLTSLVLTSCGSKSKTETDKEIVEEPKSDTVNVDCALWKSNQVIINSTYATHQRKDDKVFINKLSIIQLIGSLKLESDSTLQAKKEDLLDKLDHAPSSGIPIYESEFTPEAIQLRDQMALLIQSYMDKCPVE